MRHTGRWTIYYKDGTTYTEQDGSPFDAPGDGVQVIAKERDDGSCTLANYSDFYRWTGESWIASEIWDVRAYFSRHKGPQKIICGEECDHRSDFLKAQERAIKEGIGPR